MDKLDEILGEFGEITRYADIPEQWDEGQSKTKTAILNLLKELVGKKKTPKQKASGVSEVLTAEDVIRNDLIEEINERIDKLKNPANAGL